MGKPKTDKSQSHHSGIKTLADHGVELPRVGRNRTIVGLKHVFLALVRQFRIGRNRTIVGLKPIKAKKRKRFKKCRNRTIVGLKRGGSSKAQSVSWVAIAP